MHTITYPVTFHTETDFGVFKIGAVLPFIPVAGMQIAPCRGEDYLKVEEVYYDCGESVMDIWLIAPETASDKKRMTKLGWEIEDES